MTYRDQKKGVLVTLTLRRFEVACLTITFCALVFGAVGPSLRLEQLEQLAGVFRVLGGFR